MSWTMFAGVIAALLLFWGIGAYNRLMSLRNAIGTAFVQLDQQLSARAEASGRLLALVRPQLDSEQATFDALDGAQTEALAAVQAARAKPHAGDPVAALAVAMAVHAAALARLMSLVEHHAELNRQGEIQAELEELKLIERQRAFARQVFNHAVAQYNEAARQFPTRILASAYGFAEARSL